MSYPYNANEALALMYVQNHITPDKTPETLAMEYNEALSRINQVLFPKSKTESNEN